jgi:small-conductance mechanosensitive channel
MEQLKSFLNNEIIQIGSKSFSPGDLMLLVFSILFLFFLVSRIHRLLVLRIFPRYKMEPGSAAAVGRIVQYIILILGMMVILQTSGIDISSLGMIFGALSIGIGFGLQNITNNFISGLIILFERPIKVGDRVEIEGVAGNIIKISARSTTIITNDNIAIIVPNSEFINSKVINWSLNDNTVRFNYPVGVAYHEDPNHIRKLLMEVAEDCDGVLVNPVPDVLFEEFGDSSLNFNLRVWSQKYADRPKVLKSLLYYKIFDKFKEAGVEIPFPQRDLHIKSGLPEFKNAEDEGEQLEES